MDTSRKSLVFGARRAAAVGVAAVLVCAISYLPAGIGNVGRSRTLTGSQIDVTIEAFTFTHVIAPGETSTQARDALVSLIDASPFYSASAATDPGDPNGNSFLVTRTNGTELFSMSISENSASLQDSGTRTTIGGTTGVVGRVTPAGNPSTLTTGIYRLIVDEGVIGDFDQTFTTGPSGISTASALDAAVSSALTAAGFTVSAGSSTFTISKSGISIRAVRVDSEGSGLVVNQTGFAGVTSGIPSSPTAGVPTLSQLGMFVLVLMMTLAAIVVMRRKAPSSK